MVGDWAACGMVGGEDCAGTRVRVHWGYCARVDWVGDWRVDFYAVGDRAYEYVFVFAGGGDGRGGDFGVDCAFVFWGEERVGVERKRRKRRKTETRRDGRGDWERKPQGPRAKPALRSSGRACGAPGLKRDSSVRRFQP